MLAEGAIWLLLLGGGGLVLVAGELLSLFFAGITKDGSV